MMILGIDPGTATTGFGIVKKNDENYEFVDAGIIATKAHLKIEERLVQIANDLEDLIHQHKPSLVGIEEVFFTSNAKTAISVAQARGVCLYLLQKNNIPIVHLTPTQLKTAITGYGKADKHQVQTMTKIILNLFALPKPDDAADALAIAIAASGIGYVV